MSAPSADRRPVKSRSWKFSQGLANWLVARNCSPNLISVMGMFAGLIGGAALAMTTKVPAIAPVCYIAGAACIQIRLMANLLDGMVAIQSGKASRLGELFNEVPDRVSDTAFIAGAGFSLGSDPQLGLWAALVAMATAYVRTTAKTAGTPMDFCGPMAKQHRMAVLTVASLICGVLPLCHVTLSWSVMTVALWVILIGSTATVIRRLWRAAQFLQKSPLRDTA